jgi:hypothetical protein
MEVGMKVGLTIITSAFEWGFKKVEMEKGLV